MEKYSVRGRFGLQRRMSTDGGRNSWSACNGRRGTSASGRKGTCGHHSVEARENAMRRELELLRREKDCTEREQQLLRRELEMLRNSPATGSVTTKNVSSASSSEISENCCLSSTKRTTPFGDGNNNCNY